jgi:hypothetical protein
VLLLWVPVCFTFICGLLALASRLEEQRARTTIRLSVRSPRTSPEVAEAMVAAELAPVLARHGFAQRA